MIVYILFSVILAVSIICVILWAACRVSGRISEQEEMLRTLEQLSKPRVIKN